MTKKVKEENVDVSLEREILFEDSEGKKKVRIPFSARITFGPAVPFLRKNNFNNNKEYALRIYADSTNASLIAVFSGVGGFRDLTIPVFKYITEEEGQTIWKSDEHGFEVTRKVNKKQSMVSDFPLLSEEN